MPDTPSTSAPAAQPGILCRCCSTLMCGQFWAYMILRIVLGLALLLSGTDKFKSDTNPAFYARENWYGTEQQIKEGKPSKMVKIVKLVFENSGLDNPAALSPSSGSTDPEVLKNERAVGEKRVNFFSHLFYKFGEVLPWMFIVSGALILLGLFTRIGLFVGALTWVSLMAGQLLLPDFGTWFPLAVLAAMNAAAVSLVKYNHLSLDGVLCWIFGAIFGGDKKKA